MIQQWSHHHHQCHKHIYHLLNFPSISLFLLSLFVVFFFCLYTHHSFIFYHYLYVCVVRMSFPVGTSGKEPSCQFWRCNRCRFDPWVGRIPWRNCMAAHFSILAWRIPWIEAPGRLWCIWRVQKAGHNWSNFAHMHMVKTLSMSSIT